MEKVRLGIIGIGSMGTGHAGNVLKGMVPDMELTAVADIRQSRLDWARNNLPETVKVFDDGRKMIDSGSCDAVLVATPHYLHPEFVIYALEHGLHAISEKPAGVYTKQVREMNEAAERSDRSFAIMLNQRTNCVYRKLHEMIQSGELGQLRRVNWIITDWYRNQSYYDAAGWKATWDGEGGGVLLNNSTEPTLGVAAIAKREMKPGETIVRGIGGFDVRGEAIRLAEEPDHVPIGLLRNTVLKRALEPGQMITFDDIEVQPSRVLDIILNQRQRASSADALAVKTYNRAAL